MEQVCEVRGGQVVEGFECDKENFELDTLGNGEPVEIAEDGGDMFAGAGVGEEAGGRVLNVL